MKISLGPVPYHWQASRLRNFYRDMAGLPVDIIYLGETVCSKRRALGREDWQQIAQMLHDAGKEVVLTTLALTEAESELSALGHIAANGRWQVEANDMAAVHLLGGREAFIIGPHINIYNDRSLAFLHGLGARRWVVPVEISRNQLATILRQGPPAMEVELLGFGRMPLAFSARCFSARAHDLAKDDCGFVCSRYADGLLLNTIDGDPFLVINGIQIQSARWQNLMGHLGELQDDGVDIIRLTPQAENMHEVISAFHEVLDGVITVAQGQQRLAQIQADAFSNGYWLQQAGMEWQINKEPA